MQDQNNKVRSLFVTKSLEAVIHESQDNDKKNFKRVLGRYHLIFFGIGAIIGAGVFVLTGMAAADYAGPAIILSFIIASIAALFSGLCYAEFSSLIPAAGSAYTYSYATLGEFFAWIIGWDLVLEYSLTAATVASGWSSYFLNLLNNFNIYIPPKLTGAPGTILVWYKNAWHHLDQVKQSLEATMSFEQIAALPQMTTSFNLVAFLVIILTTFIIIFGIKVSSNINIIMVLVKISLFIIFFGVVGYYIFMHPQETILKNWKEFIPQNIGEFGKFGWSGILRASGVIFFAYIGFEAISTTAQEAKNPQKDMPIGIIGSLLICTILYVGLAGLLTAVVPYTSLKIYDPIVVGLNATGIKWGEIVTNIGIVFGFSSVMLVMILALSRIIYSIANDGLLPKWLGKIHPKSQSPYISAIIIGVFIAFNSALIPIKALAELVSIGTLLSFIIVCVAIIVLRKRYPKFTRPFRTPWVPFVPIMGIMISILLMMSLPYNTWLRLIIWFAIGMVIYFGYSYRHSKLRNKKT